MHTLYDHLGKTIGVSALTPCGVTEMEAVVAPEPRRADLRHVPDPTRDAERERLGLLGRIASIVCLIELYSGAPSDDDAIACLGKLIAFLQQRQREADKEREALKKRMEKESPGQEPGRVVQPGSGRRLRLSSADGARSLAPLGSAPRSRAATRSAGGHFAARGRRT